ncbi:hypothetical protein SAY86_009754 [Trapa natans]|uniref:Serine carboxypeptidase-like 18 n=1 Tax=Trapa natans TaxID=22666 RepID=A0AAN7KYZ2_TRANT|nr:hypothetical protein SAY86_009754 [Trapa natans]
MAGSKEPIRKCCTLVILILASSGILVSSMKVVKELPGYDGELPFYLETGYVGVGDLDESQLFYYFVESQRTPSQDPLMLWLTGGPGCSVLSAFLYESGPVEFTYVGYKGGMPSLHLNPNTWTKAMSIIYVDAPIGTGFSYSTTAENYATDDYKSSEQIYEFLRKWLLLHPQFLNNILYVGGDSYSGIPLPIIVQRILDGNNAELNPYLNLQEAKEACDGNYIYLNSTECVEYVEEIDEMILEINLMQVLEPVCKTASSRPVESLRGKRRSLEENYEGFLAAQSNPALWCRDYNYVLSGIWANKREVREALGVREGTKAIWTRCNSTLAYTKTVTTTVPFHANLTKSAIKALIYSGDHDMSVTHIGTQNWIYSLNLTLYSSWRPWFVDGQIAGYTMEYISDYGFTLDYVTVKGAGHVAPEYKPKECYEMMDRWLAYYPF